jgi:4-carboxymuconolactone decarboxylase
MLMAFVGDSELYELGLKLRTEIVGPERVKQALGDEDDLDEYFHLFGHECAHAQVWSREALPRKQRSLVTVAMLATLGPSSGTLRVHARGAIRNGCTRADLRQILAMVTWYAGVPVGGEATRTVRSALEPEEQAGVSIPTRRSGQTGLRERGRTVRERILGAQETATAHGAHDAHERIQETHYFGILWTDGDLSVPDRCLVLIGILLGANRLDDAETWFAVALHAGCKGEELEEVLLTASIYCGELIYGPARRALEGALAAALK